MNRKNKVMILAAATVSFVFASAARAEGELSLEAMRSGIAEAVRAGNADAILNRFFSGNTGVTRRAARPSLRAVKYDDCFDSGKNCEKFPEPPPPPPLPPSAIPGTQHPA